MSENAEEPYFYHCFPQSCARVQAREGPSDRPYDPRLEAQVGFDTLDLILRFGLMLPSETLDLDLPSFAANAAGLRKSRKGKGRALRDGALGVPINRACFTLAHAAELNAGRKFQGKRITHHDLFGRFAVGLRTDRGRALGLLPVHYFYRDAEAQEELKLGGLSGLSATYLLEIRDILTLLAYSHRKRKVRRGEPVDFEAGYEAAGLEPHFASPEDVERIFAAIDQASEDQLQYVYDLLDFEHRHIGVLADSINMLLGIHQAIDSRRFREEFLYYFQKEWRLIPTQSTDALLYPASWEQNTGENAKSTMRAFNTAALEMARRNGIAPPDFTSARILHGHRALKAPFRAFIDVVICPPEYEDQVRQRLGRPGLEHVQVIAQ